MHVDASVYFYFHCQLYLQPRRRCLFAHDASHGHSSVGQSLRLLMRYFGSPSRLPPMADSPWRLARLSRDTAGFNASAMISTIITAPLGELISGDENSS